MPLQALSPNNSFHIELNEMKSTFRMTKSPRMTANLSTLLNLWTCIIGKTFYMSDLYDVFFNYVSTMSLFFFFLLFCYFVSNRKFINKHIV